MSNSANGKRNTDRNSKITATPHTGLHQTSALGRTRTLRSSAIYCSGQPERQSGSISRGAGLRGSARWHLRQPAQAISHEACDEFERFRSVRA